MKRAFVIFLFLAGGILSRAASASLLEQAVESWLGERDHWAFTQRAVEYEAGTPHERLERFDPSLPGNQRWQLLAIDGRRPTSEQRAKWEKRKFGRHHRRFETPIGDFFDFAHAKVAGVTARTIRYDVPLRTDQNWLFPVDKVDVIVTITKDTHALEHLTAHVREPFKVLLGLARINGGDLDLDFLPSFDTDHPDATPDTAQPSGSARVTVSKLGERIDFTWSDFKRVTPYDGPNGDSLTRVP